MNLDVLRTKACECTRCPELKARRQIVFGAGPTPARLMLIGEAPGENEDKKGIPFVGLAGKLLTNIIKACGWKREDIYIANILLCRPPGNRRPTPKEAGNCREYLDAQIAAVAPEWIVCLGATAANNLLGQNKTVGEMRERLFEHGTAKVVCTYHPSYLLRNPMAKTAVWNDLQPVMRGLNP